MTQHRMNIGKPNGLTGIEVTLFFGAILFILSAHASDTPEIDQVLAITADPDYGEYLAGECMTCHTNDSTSDSIPIIKGQSAEYLATALLAYKNEERENATMRSIAGAMGIEEIAALAAYFSEIKE